MIRTSQPYIFALALVAVACGGSTGGGGGTGGSAGGGSGSCEYGGKSYQIGESWGSGCNTCQCTASGVECTAMPCAAPCTYGDKTYTPGQTFPAGDGCNTCTCESDGSVSCTLMECLGPYCKYDGKTYAPGQTFPATDGCNTCSCQNDGSVACTEIACAPTCVYAGKSYAPGETFPALDGCNTCSCGSDGTISCTLAICACDPDGEWWRSYVAKSPQECAVIDYTCPENTTPFANSCGCGCEQSAECPQYFDCMPPANCNVDELKKKCPYSGFAY